MGKASHKEQPMLDAWLEYAPHVSDSHHLTHRVANRYSLNIVSRIYVLVTGRNKVDVRADIGEGDSACGEGRCRSIVKRTAFH